MPHDRATSIITAIVCALGASGSAWSAPSRGQVTVPLKRWEALLERLESRPAPPAPPAAVVTLSRSLDGSFAQGLLRATLVVRFEVLAAGHVKVPVVSDAALVSDATLDRGSAALTREGGMLVVGVDRPGPHQLTLQLLVGESQDHFARRLQLRLAPGGATRLSIVVPEPEIDATLTHGVLTAVSAGGLLPERPAGTRGPDARAGSTLLQGCLDASGELELTWARRVTHRTDRAARLQARGVTLLTVDEALVRGLAVLDLTVSDGELDRVELRLPPAAEPLAVTGDAVLEWRAVGQERLAVLLRRLVRGNVRITVRYQLPGAASRPIAAPMILPLAGVSYAGVAAIQAPAGLEVRARARDARGLDLRDLPAELGDLTRSPLVAAFAFQGEPNLTLTVTRRQQVSLTTTIIDELHAATVLLEGGGEQTKLRLNLRNNTRQYLAVHLPPGATLTQALLDGQPVRPARVDRGGAAPLQLLFPLRQSERVDPDAGRLHRVEAGETLGEIAHHYYSDPARWPLILRANSRLLRSERDLRPGLRLVIPSAREVTIEESSFVLELSYHRARSAPGLLGRARFELPELDVDVMRVHWHVYLPTSVAPLRFTGNLTQLTLHRDDPLRRAWQYLREALSGRRAWAGEYRSILAQRKRIFEDEARSRGEKEALPASFPLIGERYRFRRILAAHEPLTIEAVYARRSVVAAARWGALLVAGVLVLLLLRGGRWWARLGCGVGVVLLLGLGHLVPGVHRRMLWGAVLALAIDLYRRRRRRGAGRWRVLLRAPWTATGLVRPRTLAVTVGALLLCWLPLSYPMLLSTTTLLALGTWRLWPRRPDSAGPSLPEVDDAPQATP